MTISMTTATATPAAPKRGAYQRSATNLAIVTFVDKSVPCDFDQLQTIFSDGDSAEDREHFRNRLNYLVETRRLSATGRGRARIFLVGALPYGPGKRRQRTPVLAPLALKYVGPIVPPRRVEVMFGPVYHPGPGPALRPGALDYKAIARRGHAC